MGPTPSASSPSRTAQSRFPFRAHRMMAVVLLALALLVPLGCARQPAAQSRTKLDLARQSWWGGPSYYAAFPKARQAGWTNPSFFPIAVFYGKPSQAQSLWSIGINTYMGAEHDGSSMTSITDTGMSVLAQLSEWTPQEVGDDDRVVGWHLSDECDMGSDDCTGDEYARLAQQQEYAATARARNDGRLLQANFGNGVLSTFWAANTMAQQVSLVDLTSVDKYAYTSPDVDHLLTASPHWPAGKEPRSAFAYGWQQQQMESFSKPPSSRPNWVFVEVAMPYLNESDAATITGDQIEGAVWNSIINGASGIAYFQHNNDGQCGNYALIDCAAARDRVAQINKQISSLATVLNSQSYVWNFGDGLQTSLKMQDGDAYVFAMTDGGAGRRTFELPEEVRGKTVTVVGEGRTLQVHDGTFSDDFASEATHHIYRIAV